MFCPKCKYEYRPDVKICPTCNVELVESLILNDKDLPDDIKDWVHLARINSHDMAEMFLETLRLKDIPSVLTSGTGFFGITGQIGISTYNPIGGGYSLYVPEEYIDDVDNEGKIMFGEEWEHLKLIEIDHIE